MAFVKMFKAAKQTRRFNLNQDVWVSFQYSNHLRVRFRYRGKGKWVDGLLKTKATNYQDWNPIIGESGLRKIEVSDEFARRFDLQCFEKGAD